MGALVIGAIRIDLGLETTAFTKGATQAQREAQALAKRMEAIGTKMTSVGVVMSAGITAPFAALVASAVPAAKESAQALGQVEAALKSMGEAAGFNSPQLQKMAKDLQKISTFDDDEILRKVTANMLTFGNISGESFEKAQLAAVNLSARMGGDLQASALLLGKALNVPEKGLAALKRVGIQFTEQQTEQIKKMAQAGDVAGAQAIMLAELEKQFGGSAKALRDATPEQDAIDAWGEFQETVGAIVLEVLPPLTKLLTDVLQVFNNLSPGMQQTVVAGVAIAAALGPVLIGLGSLVTIGSALAPILVPIAAGLGAVLAAVTPLVISLAPLIIALGAVVAAWYYWDEIKPIIERLGAAVMDWYRVSVKPTVDAVMNTLRPFVEFFKSFFGAQITGVLNVISALLRGDFSGAWEAAKNMVAAMGRSIITLFQTLAPGVIQSVKAMYDGVKLWIQDKLGAVFNWLGQKVEQVKGFFFGMYDAVVGHSYVPDMVDGIGSHMARLQGLMVDTAAKATSKTTEAFRKMADEVTPLLERLFPEAAAENKYKAEMDLIARAEKAGAGKGGLTAAQAEAARRRLAEERYGDPISVTAGQEQPGIDKIERELQDYVDMLDSDLVKPTEDRTAKTVQSWVEMAEGIVGSMEGMVNAFKRGDIVGGILGVLDLIGQVANTIAGISGNSNSFQGFGSQRTTFEAGDWGFSSFGGGRALGGPVVPGKMYRVGERGPEYVSFGAKGHITPEGPGGGNVYNISGNLLTPEFWEKIQAMDDQAATRGAMAGASLVQENMQRRGRQQLGRR